MDWASNFLVVVIICLNVYNIESAGTLGTSCTISSNCIVANSKCTKNKCQCRATFEGVGAACKPKGTLGTSCIAQSDCTVTHSTCTQFTCQCDAGFENVGAACKTPGAMYTICSADTHCIAANSRCTDNTCQCKDLFRIYGEECKTSGELDASCSSTENCTRTVSHSTCSSHNHTCQCAPGYMRKGAVCQNRGPGDTCAVTSDCSALPHADCTDGNCTCVTGFEVSETICEITIGGPCITERDCGHLENTNCTGVNKSLTCSCVTGYTSVKNRCVLTPVSAADILRTPSVVIVTMLLGIVMAARGYI